MKIDYSKYTLEELREVRRSIDEDAYPDRVVEIETLLSEKENTPEEIRRFKTQLERDKYSTFGPRFVASIIDAIALSILSAVLVFIGTKGDGVIQTALEYVDYMQFAIYSVVLHGLYGQTLGKMALDVKVVDVKNEGSISFKQALLRDCVPIIVLILMLFTTFFIPEVAAEDELPQWVIYSMFGFSFALIGWHLLEIITMLFNEKRRALHDFIAGTVVIRT